MDEIRYLISDASKKVDVETHVLRYWEEELGIAIPRNEMGHRYYTEFHIRLFCQVKKLKDKGYQLKAIKNALQQVMAHNQGLAETGILLEEDMSRTLGRSGIGQGTEEKNEEYGGEANASVSAGREPRYDASRQSDLEVLDEGETQVQGDIVSGEDGLWQDEPEETGSEEMNRYVPKSFGGITRLADYSRLEPAEITVVKPVLWSERETPEEEGEETGEKEVKRDEEIEAGQEIETTCEKVTEREGIKGEEDGLSNMKNRAKNRKKPSAWERRNGMLAAEKSGAEETMEKSDVFAAGANTEESSGRENQIRIMQVKGEHAENGRDLEMTAEETGIHERAGGEAPVSGKWEKDPNLQDEQVSRDGQIEEIGLNETEGEEHFAVVSRDEKMQQFQEIMNHIIGRALEVNNEKLSQEISGLVNHRLTEELEDLMRIRDEREEERYRQLDEIIRSFQRESQGKAEAAATRIPFFRKKRFGRNGKQIK